jgi:hypothetical protein
MVVTASLSITKLREDVMRISSSRAAILGASLLGFLLPPSHGLALQKAPTQTQEKDESGLSFPDQVLPAGARLFVAPMPNGFETYVIAGLQQKKVPVVVVTIREKADFELTGVSESDKASWAKTLFTGSTATSETASVKIVNMKTGEVVFGYSVNKGSSARGKQSAGEAVAKHIKDKIEQPR